MNTDLAKCKDKYDELFIIIIYLLEEGSLTNTTEIREFIEILESGHIKANSVILKAIRKSDIAPDRKVQLERELRQ